MSLLVRDAEVVVTMDASRREIRGGSVFVRDGRIEAVGAAGAVQEWIASDRSRVPGRVIDARGCVVTPGLVNGHHHMFQSLTRAVGTGKGLELFDWLKLLFGIWRHLDPRAAYLSAKL